MSSGLADEFVTLHEFIQTAHLKLNRNIWEYLVGGTETETTLRRNRHALDSVAFRPRVLVDVSKLDATHDFLGKHIRLPVALAPVGALEYFEPGGGATSASAAGQFNVPVFISSATQPGLEASAAAGTGPRIFQLYVRGDNAFIDDHVRRAIDAGYEAFCITVDSALHSRRERDIVKRFQNGYLGNNNPVIPFQSELNWKDIERFKSLHKIPLILKGIATAEDAERACQLGVDVIYVSNHGGRQLDHCPGTLDVLPEVAAAVAGRAKVYVDGGFSRGSDILKGVAFGADLVVIGRLYVYGIAAAGAPGVVRVLELLEAEVLECLGLLGVANLSQLNRSYLQPARPVNPGGVHGAFPLLTLTEG